jgi:hypothetical protein
MTYGIMFAAVACGVGLLVPSADVRAESEVINACINQSGLTRVVSATSACSNSETALSWPSATSTQTLLATVATLRAEIATLQDRLAAEELSRAEADGVLAGTIAALPPLPEGLLSGFEVVHAYRPPSTDGGAFLQAKCPQGKVVLGGGGTTGAFGATPLIAATYPDGVSFPFGETWTVRAILQAGETSLWDLHAFAICATVN